ncbi:MAG: hypothetical protein CL935_05845 [Deltaproteobacteria bacterium]|nr:hypothetical protein [Deltaproteobacteria bacterium]
MVLYHLLKLFPWSHNQKTSLWLDLLPDGNQDFDFGKMFLLHNSNLCFPKYNFLQILLFHFLYHSFLWVHLQQYRVLGVLLSLLIQKLAL